MVANLNWVVVDPWSDPAFFETEEEAKTHAEELITFYINEGIQGLIDLEDIFIAELMHVVEENELVPVYKEVEDGKEAGDDIHFLRPQAS